MLDKEAGDQDAPPPNRGELVPESAERLVHRP
jgi:hypothetical protein